MTYKENILKTLTLILVLGTFLLAGCQTTGKTTAKANFQSTAPDGVVSFDGSRVAYDVRGQGDITLVFIHCWTCNSSFWDGQVEFFANDYRVITLDLLGQGRSVSKRARYTMESFGKDVAAVVDKVGAKKIVLVGHSMGGPVALEAAKLLGDRVIGIVGVDSFYTSFQHPRNDQELEALLKPFKDDFPKTSEYMVRLMFTPNADPKLVDDIVTRMGAADSEIAIDMIYEYFAWYSTKFKGSEEEFSPIFRNINAAQSGKEEPQNESILLMSNVGHFIPQVAPDRFNEVLGAMVTGFISGKSCDK